jgi:coenzyme F420 hydrogenase subunit beta
MQCFLARLFLYTQRMPTDTSSAPTTRWTHQWDALYNEVITTGLCTGCSGCVIACPHEVLGYSHEPGGYIPFHLETDFGPSDCGHGQRGCTACTRACPRFRDWEHDANMHLFGRDRTDEELSGISEQKILVRATHSDVHEAGQDGGFVSAMLIWLLEEDYIDGALVSQLEGDGSTWHAIPAVATTREEVLRAAGSRYTYSANPLAIRPALERGLERLALVGMSCQSSIPPVMWHRKAGKISNPIIFNVGLLCSKTFDDAIFSELFHDRYSIVREDIVKMNIKGVFQIWMSDGTYHEVNLKEAHAWTREGCKTCPDFAAQHADIATGGIGKDNDWTLCVVRTDVGREVMARMIRAGVIEAKPADDDEIAMKLLRQLSIVSRRRWPETANAQSIRQGVPPPKKNVPK